jgi:hypothetical protein
MRGLVHPDQSVLNATQNILCKAVNRRRGCCVCRANNCRRRARFSRTRSSRERKALTNQPRKCRSDTIMARILTEKSESSLSLSHSFCQRTTFWRGTAQSNPPDFGETWEEGEAIAEKTAKIDFGCDFKGNTCRAMREDYRGCCCQSCNSRHGYLQKIKPSAFNEILSLFDRVWGFWRPGVGCILPRKWQSPTCLFYGCLPFMKEKDRHDLIHISESAGNSKPIGDALALAVVDAQTRAH